MTSSIERAHKLMSAFKKGEDLTREELIYLYALYLLYRDIGIRLHDTHIINCYCNDILSEIEEKLNNKTFTKHSIDYAMIINEQKTLEYILKFERKYIN